MRGPRDTSRIIGGGAYIVDPRHFTCHVTGYGVRAFPICHDNDGKRVLVPGAPRLTHCRNDVAAAAEYRRLGAITCSTHAGRHILVYRRAARVNRLNGRCCPEWCASNLMAATVSERQEANEEGNMTDEDQC